MNINPSLHLFHTLLTLFHSPALFRVSLIRQFAPFISRIGSPAFRRKLVDITPNATVQKIKMMSDVMYDTAKDILRDKKDMLSRSKDAHEQTHDPKDIISILRKRLIVFVMVC